MFQPKSRFFKVLRIFLRNFCVILGKSYGERRNGGRQTSSQLVLCVVGVGPYPTSVRVCDPCLGNHPVFPVVDYSVLQYIGMLGALQRGVYEQWERTQ